MTDTSYNGFTKEQAEAHAAHFDRLAREATSTAFRVEHVNGGARISWGDDPLDFIWQSEAQCRDLIAKLSAAD